MINGGRPHYKKHYRVDSKRLAKIRAKKLAHGQKPDDHEPEENYDYDNNYDLRI